MKNVSSLYTLSDKEREELDLIYDFYIELHKLENYEKSGKSKAEFEERVALFKSKQNRRRQASNKIRKHRTNKNPWSSTEIEDGKYT